LAGFLLLATLFLSACAEIMTIPTIQSSQNGTWVAFLTSREFASRFHLQVVNLENGQVMDIGTEGDQQGAFAWHPNRAELAYFNLSADGVPSIRLTSLQTPTEGVELLGSLAFPSSFWVNQMAFSPDGNHLAMVVWLLPFGSVIDPNQGYAMNEIQAALYIANLGNGQTHLISPNGVYPTTLAWSPDGAYLAYTAWADDDQDGVVNMTLPANGLWRANRDHFRVFIYNTQDETTFPVGGTDYYYAPAWLSAQRLLLLAIPAPQIDLDLASVVLNPRIVAYDLTTQSAETVVTGSPDEIILSFSLAPDHQKLAYVTLPANADHNTVTTSSTVWLARLDVSGNSQAIYTTDGTTGILDMPLWTPDSTHLFLTTANPPSARRTAFAEFDETIPSQTLVLWDIESGQVVRTLYEGTMTSSMLLQFNLRGN
jgi:Tol biopolymer transport system component